MSAIASFVLECAKSGRWARGLLALQGSLRSNDPALRHARTRLAAVAALHHWQSALTLLQGCDVRQEYPVVCRVLECVSRHASQPRQVYLQAVIALLHAAAPRSILDVNISTTQTTLSDVYMNNAQETGKEDIQGALYLSATRWASWCEALLLYRELDRPSAACQARLDELTALHRASANASCCFDGYCNSEEEERVEEMLSSSFDVSDTQRLWQRRHRAQRQARREQYTLRAALQPLPTSTSMAFLLQAAVRWPSIMHATVTSTLAEDETSDSDAMTSAGPLWVGWRTALTLLADQHLTKELAWLYGRCVGLRAPQLCHKALTRLQQSEEHNSLTSSTHFTTNLERMSRRWWLCQVWLASRASWQACLPLLERLRPTNAEGDKEASKSVDDDEDYARRMAEELLARTTMPRTIFYRYFPNKRRPSYRLPQLTRRAIARALAQGYRLDALQLSALVKRWAREGRWDHVLQIYARLPTQEFQRYAMQAALGKEEGRSDDAAVQIEAALQRLLQCAPHMAPSTHCMCLLIHRAAEWHLALRVFRACVQHGGKCNPQVMSALMDTSLPPEELRRLLHAYPAAVNAGVRRRAHTLLAPVQEAKEKDDALSGSHT